ncbi:hypothetical protein [Aeoliella sp. SH292]|uniref:hypothetical protein n=1 Tax=Aeoliella sp. SH292 TaxID=3454464 RepID=UPI003F99163D
MLRHLATTMAAATVITLAAQSAAAYQVIAPPVASSGPQYDGNYSVAKLFDASVTDGDVGVTSYGNPDGQWAGFGEGPHEVFMDFGASISPSAIAYAQRSGDLADADKIGAVDFWFSDTDFAGIFPVDAPDTTATITNTTDTILHPYSLGGTFSGQYVAARFNAASPGLAINNPGGSEFRFLAVPEPSSVLLATLACTGFAYWGSRRR